MKKSLKRLYKYAKRRIAGEGVINFRGQGIVNLIDVGSAGKLPSPWKENNKLIRHLLSFEPRTNDRRNPNIISLDVALWESNEERVFYIYEGRGGSGSSLFKQNHDYVNENFNEIRRHGPQHLADSWVERSQLKRTDKITCRKLDDVLNEINHPFPYHFIKIDAQGAEYEILKGGEKYLSGSCLGLHLELFVIPLYKGIKLLPEVAEYLNGLGFELAKKFPSHGSFNSQHDCLFLKRGKHNKVIDTIREIYRL